MNTSHPVDVVVGAASGMGAAAAQALKGSKRLLLVDRDAEGLDRLATKLACEAIVCDLTDPDSIEEFAGQIHRLGSMIVTAGVSGAPGALTLNVNLVGYARLLRALDHAVGEGTAAVLFASMVDLFRYEPDVVEVLDDPLAPDFFDKMRAVGIDPDDPGQAYVMSKVGVIRLVRKNCTAWWHRGARINSVSPGMIDTPMLAQFTDLPSVQATLRTVRRWGRPEEVGAVAAFLVSEKASYVNGINVTVDGGLVTATQEGATTE